MLHTKSRHADLVDKAHAAPKIPPALCASMADCVRLGGLRKLVQHFRAAVWGEGQFGGVVGSVMDLDCSLCAKNCGLNGGIQSHAVIDVG